MSESSRVFAGGTQTEVESVGGRRWVSGENSAPVPVVQGVGRTTVG